MKPPKSGVSSGSRMLGIQQNYLFAHHSLGFQVMVSLIFLTIVIRGHQEKHKNQTEQ